MDSHQRLHVIRQAYHQLETRVRRALVTQVGDSARLDQHKREVLTLLASAFEHSDVIPPQELENLQVSVNNMVSALDEATSNSNDPPACPAPVLVDRSSHGARGRPRVQINRQFLTDGLTLSGPTHLASLLRCHPRTVRRRALETGLVEPGSPIFIDYTTEDGTVQRLHFRHNPNNAAAEVLSDGQLDTLMSQILDIFPGFGRTMILGELRHFGHSVTRERVRQSYQRVRGLPACFGRRRIERRTYNVPGPMSLWHHDGQHGLIHFRIVIHGFIDGYSRLITGLRAHNNNRADTVFQLFQDAISVHGVPSRVRGDHGWENYLVAVWMESDEGMGPNRGSYIWGRSIHNIRIERLWFDLTQGLGAKWFTFFQDLERTCGLDTNNDAHMWLLHYLFLDQLNTELDMWSGAWNDHKLSLTGQRNQSPRQLFYFGCIEHGMRGRHADLDDNNFGDDYLSYGIDWEALEEDNLRNHHDIHTTITSLPSDIHTDNAFVSQAPEVYSYVDVPTQECPLQDDEQATLLAQLNFLKERHSSASTSSTMEIKKLLWCQALDVCMRIH